MSVGRCGPSKARPSLGCDDGWGRGRHLLTEDDQPSLQTQEQLGAAHP